MEQERRKVLNNTLDETETLGFFAAIGMHFAKSTLPLSEELGDYVKGTPWESFSSTDQCFKMVHQLAIKVWHNLENIVTCVESKIEEEKEEEKELKLPPNMPSYAQTIIQGMLLRKTAGETFLSSAAEEKQLALTDVQKMIESIGFFAAIGIHFAEATPLLSEELGKHIKGTPWERFSSTDQCFKMVHKLAVKIWRNLEGIVPFKEPGAEEKIEPAPEPKDKETPSYFQTIAGEVSRLKIIGESIVSLAGDEKQVSELDPGLIKTLGETIINAAANIKENLLKLKGRIYQEHPVGARTETQMEKSLELIGEEMNRIKAFGASMVAMAMAFHEGFKLNPRQIESIGQMVMDLADKVTKEINLYDS